MTHDTLGRVTAERLGEILVYAASAQWLASDIHLFSQIKHLSLSCMCDEDILVLVADLTNDAYLKELVAVYGNHYRLFTICDDMFRQVMALPLTQSVSTDDERRPFVLEAMADPNAVRLRASALNLRTLEETKLSHPDKLVYAMLVNTDNILDIPPSEFICTIDEDRILLDYSPELRPSCLAPGYSVKELFKSVVKPRLYHFLDRPHADDTLYDPENEIIYALNTCR